MELPGYSSIQRDGALLVLQSALICLSTCFCPGENTAVVTSRISLPSGPGSIEGLGESFEPQLNNGSFAVTLPLKFSTVRGRVQPDVQLVYDSGFGNGPLGLGWRLQVPCVQRQTDKGLPEYSQADTFVDSSGEELVRLTDRSLRAENEGGFVRWEYLGTNGWRGTLPDGTVQRFGNTAQSRLEHPALGAFRWMLEFAQDPNGNRAEYFYRKDAGQIYLSAVEFGRHVTLPSSFYRVAFQYETNRPDPFADYRGRFRAETRWRLGGITLESAGERIRYWQLIYQTNAPLSLLSSFVQFGDSRSKIGTGSELNVDYLPPITFGYSSAQVGPSRHWTEVGPFQNISFSRGEAELVDLNRDSLADLLLYDKGTYYSCLNNGPSRPFGQLTAFTSQVFYPPLNAPTMRLADLRGDGSVKVLVEDGGSYYYRAFASATKMGTAVDYLVPGSFSLSDSEVQVMDIDNDRAIDFFAPDAGDSTFTMILSRAGRGSGTVLKSKPTSLARSVNFANGWQFADLNGDRMPDLALIGTVEEGGSIFYPGMGYGEFDSPETIANGPAGPTDADRADGGLKLVDIDSDGLADLVSVHSGVLKVWVNRAGKEWAAPVIITDPEVPDWNASSTAVRFADMNGNGSVDVVWNDPGQAILLRYVDLLPGSRPNVLTQMANGMGRQLQIEYRTSTDFMLAAATNNPWTIVPPFPIPVVSAFTERDSLGGVYRAELSYRNGYYDALEREFRGFETAVRRDIGDEAGGAPTLVTEYAFDTGAGAEVLKGKVVSVETRTQSGAIFQRQENRWEPRTLPLNTASNESRHVHFAELRSTKREVVEGLGPERAVTLEQEFHYDDYGNQTFKADYGIVANSDRSAHNDERITLTEFALNTNAWILRYPALEKIMDELGKEISRAQFFYDDETFSGTNLFQVTAGNLTMKWEWTDPNAPAKFVRSTRTKYDRFGNAEALLDPLAQAPGGVIDGGIGHFRQLEYDPVFHTYPITEMIELGENKEPLVFRAGYNLAFGVVTNSIDFNRNTTSYFYDTFARLTSIVKPYDSTEFPTVEYDYVLAQPVGQEGIVNYVESRQLDKDKAAPGDHRSHYFISRQFVDGLGRNRMTKTEAEPETKDGPARVTVKAATLFNARQKPQLVVNPYFSTLSGDLDEQLAFENIEAPGWQGQFHKEGALFSLTLATAHQTATEYDATLRETRTINADSTFRSTVYEPLITRSYDENDTDATSQHFNTPIAHYHDGLGRLVRMDEITRLNDDGTTTGALRAWTTRYEYDLNDQLTKITDSQNNVKIFQYDGLKRKTFMNDPDRGVMHWFYDEASNLKETVDAKSQRITYTYDGANRIRTEKYHNGQPPPPWRGAGEGATSSVVYHYDVPFPDLPQGDNTTATASNTKGALAWVEDLSGEEHTSYDSRGRVKWLVKRIPDLQFLSHYGSSPLVAYRTSFGYDSLDRNTRLVYPDNDEISYVYDDRNLLQAIIGGVNGLTQDGHVVPGISYAPSGQMERTDYGNGVRTTHTYDSRLRLKQILTVSQRLAPSEELIHFAYDFDAVSNIKSITDQRPVSVVPADDPRRNTQVFRYDDLYRLTHAGYVFAVPPTPLPSGWAEVQVANGKISYRYDRIGNMLAQASTFTNHVEKGQPVADLGEMDSGGLAGRSGRIGRAASDPPGPHALTTIRHPKFATRNYPYDANGNMTDIDGLVCAWDFKDRLIAVENSEMRAEYTYDYTDRRIAKDVSYKPGSANFMNNNPRLTTLYIDKYFEVREYDAPTKYVWNGNTRVARVTGSLSSNLRVQRLRVYSGWNLCSLAVSSRSPIWGEGWAKVLSTGFHWNPATLGWDEVLPGKTLSTGTVLWLKSATNAILAITGSYIEPTNRTVTASGDFVPGAGLQAWNVLSIVTNPFSAGVWRFDAQMADWTPRLAPPLEMPSKLPNFIAPGEAVFVSTDVAIQLENPDVTLQVRYYHQDHLGSSGIIADPAGGLVEYVGYYPFGQTRCRFIPGNLNEPYGFIQKEQDGESSLYYMEARYYSGILCRFLSADPCEFGTTPGGTRAAHKEPAPNAYAYSYNNPITFVDATGLQGEAPPSNSQDFSGYEDNDPISTKVWTERGVATKYDFSAAGLGSVIVTMKASDNELLEALDSTAKIEIGEGNYPSFVCMGDVQQCAGGQAQKSNKSWEERQAEKKASNEAFERRLTEMPGTIPIDFERTTKRIGAYWRHGQKGKAVKLGIGVLWLAIHNLTGTANNEYKQELREQRNIKSRGGSRG